MKPLRKTYPHRHDLEEAARWVVLARGALGAADFGHRATSRRHRGRALMWVFARALPPTSSSVPDPADPAPRLDGRDRTLFIVALVGVMVFDIRSYLFGILALNVVVVFVSRWFATAN